MNILKGEVKIKDVGLRFTSNANLAFCEDRGIDSPSFKEEYEKDPATALRDLTKFAHFEYCRKYKEDKKLESKEDVMDFIEEMNEEEGELLLKAILKSNKLSDGEEESPKEEKK